MNYKWFAFISRVALLCNIFFVACLFIRYTTFHPPQFISGFLLIAGWFMSPFLNFAAAFCLLLLTLKKINGIAPLWINGINLFILFFQVFYFMI